MTHAEMNRSMAEAIVRRSLYGIQTDPKRTIRNLVERVLREHVEADIVVEEA